ncbi:hypothetical protein LJC30_00960 [Odoribacter sp. OttesenSCG-928-L07]|nr:hypothetical protein [Odoribacter sp. OttesenSCG-928-L07]MDL2239509.1 hypothetical protein [Bacteroidales bacterium OttesenSCG-928-L14]
MSNQENITLDGTKQNSNSEISSEMIEELRKKQRLVPGIVAGLIAGIIVAILWGITNFLTIDRWGYYALVIAIAVGLANRKFGKGVDKIFGIWGAIITFFCVLLGHFLGMVGYAAGLQGIGFFEALTSFNSSYLSGILYEKFNIFDIFYYSCSVWLGYKASFIKVNGIRIRKLIKNM